MAQLDTQQLQLIEAKIANERKSAGLAYLFWFFLGGLAIHNFYLGKVKLAVFQLVGGLLAILLMAIGGAGTQPNDVSPSMIVGAVLLVGWALTFIGDLFLIPGRVREHKERLRQQYSAELSGPSQAMVQR